MFFEEKKMLCAYCEKPLIPGHVQRGPTKEHRIPVSRGGARKGDNVTSACVLCNRTKGNMTDAEFMQWIKIGRPKKSQYLRSIGLR
jgi:5-methylcytosine-specific restriction endonuclease McrA